MGDSHGNFEIFVRKLRAGFPFCGGYAIMIQMKTGGGQAGAGMSC